LGFTFCFLCLLKMSVPSASKENYFLAASKENYFLAASKEN
jgi:hypothetical protein